MEIGLMRHYRVNHRFQRLSDAATFNRDMEIYNQADIVLPPGAHPMGNWDVCFTSAMKRAIETGRHVFRGKIRVNNLLNEVPMHAGFRTRLKLPLFLWAFIARAQWLIQSARQKEGRDLTLSRARTFMSEFSVKENDDARILVISHGFFLVVLRRVLRGFGFRGRAFLKAKNGRIYLFRIPSTGVK